MAHTSRLSPAFKKFDDVGNQIHVSSFTVLWRADDTPGVAPTNSHDRLIQVDVTPTKSKQFALPYPGLQRDQTQRLGVRVVELGEETRKFLVLEIGCLLPFGARPVRRRQFPYR